MRAFKSVQPGGNLSASELNRAFDEVERLGNLTTSPPLEVSRTSQGLALRIVGYGFWAQIGSGSSSSYDWTEVQPVGDGTFTIVEAARTGTTSQNPAIEVNGNAGVPSDSVVWLIPGAANEYLFSYAGVASPVWAEFGYQITDSVPTFHSGTILTVTWNNSNDTTGTNTGLWTASNTTGPFSEITIPTGIGGWFDVFWQVGFSCTSGFTGCNIGTFTESGGTPDLDHIASCYLPAYSANNQNYVYANGWVRSILLAGDTIGIGCFADITGVSVLDGAQPGYLFIRETE